MPKTAQEWQQHLNLAAVPDPAFVTALNALEGQEWIEGAGLEVLGLVDHALTLQDLVGLRTSPHAG